MEARFKTGMTQPILWALDVCPACQSKELMPDYSTGEIFCRCCGLVIF